MGLLRITAHNSSSKGFRGALEYVRISPRDFRSSSSSSGRVRSAQGWESMYCSNCDFDGSAFASLRPDRREPLRGSGFSAGCLRFLEVDFVEGSGSEVAGFSSAGGSGCPGLSLTSSAPADAGSSALLSSAVAPSTFASSWATPLASGVSAGFSSFAAFLAAAALLPFLGGMSVLLESSDERESREMQ